MRRSQISQVDESRNGYMHMMVRNVGPKLEKSERKRVCVCVSKRERILLLGVGYQSSRIENHEFKHTISVSIHDVIN